MAGILAAIKEGLAVVAGVFRHQTHRSKENNSKEMKKAKSAKELQDLRDENREVVGEEDLDEIRKRMS